LEVYFSFRLGQIVRCFIAISVLYILLLLPSLISSSAAAVAVTQSVNIFPPDSKPYGLSYEEHVKNFWKWIISFPIDKSPWNDATGANCDNGQSKTNSSVFYLSGNGGGTSVRTCKVPAGKGLFIPVSPMEVSDKEAPNRSVEDLHKIAKKDQDSVTSLYLKINDKEYSRADLSKYRIHPGVIEVTFPKNAIFGATEGISKAAADGYYVITEPLAKGTYTIQYKSSLICPGTDCLEPNFAQDVKYIITVE
jgi:hypothetical protein